MTEGDPRAEQALQSLHSFLANYWSGHRTSWMHDVFGSDFHQGEAYALTGLVLIPEVAAALVELDKEVGSQMKVVSNLKRWHTRFERKE